jgi:hypothetical protein
MPPAVAAAGIAAAGAIGGAVIGSSAQKKAAGQAADTQRDATAAQLQLGKDSLALQKEMFNQGLDFNKMQAGVSYDMLSPFVGSGLGATGALNALLGITPVDMGANPYNTPSPATPAPPAAGSPPPAAGGGGFAGSSGGPFGSPYLNKLIY